MNGELRTAFGACIGTPEKAFEAEKAAVSSAYRRDTIEESTGAFRDFRAFCMPGHKGRLDPLDQSEHDEDCLFPAASVAKAEAKAAKHYGVKKARFLVCGASMGVKAAFIAAKRDTVAPEFTHRSAVLGAFLAGTQLFTFPTGEEFGLPKVPAPADYERAFGVYPTAQAALVTSPDYFGRTADVKGIKAVCERRGKLLIVDAAHGAHFATRPDIFPVGGEKYADFAVLSAHKTLRALTQSAIGAVNNERYFAAYDEALDLIGTTSPSYRLLASLENAIAFEETHGAGYDNLKAACDEFRSRVKCLNTDDPLRITVDCGAYGTTGERFYYECVRRRIMPETFFGNYCVFIITLSDEPEGVRGLTDEAEKILLKDRERSV